MLLLIMKKKECIHARTLACWKQFHSCTRMSMIFWCLSYMRNFIIMAAQPSSRLVTYTLT